MCHAADGERDYLIRSTPIKFAIWLLDDPSKPWATDDQGQIILFDDRDQAQEVAKTYLSAAVTKWYPPDPRFKTVRAT
jgi:hypothetical protein